MDYIKAAVATIKEALQEKGRRFPCPLKIPTAITYVPELDVTEELGTDDIRFYQEMIGMLRWATELGRVDILQEISILSQYQASP